MKAETVPPLQIDLEDGFSGDTVVVSAGGDELWQGDDLTTNPSSVAAIAKLDVPPGQVVEVSVPTRHLTKKRRVTTPFLRVNVTDGQLVLEESKDLPLHM
jgi:hypothetical protein